MFCNRFPWFPLTPSVYYNGMSYYEDLCKLAGCLNDVIKEIDDMNIDSVKSDVSTLLDEYKQLKTQMDNLSTTVGGVMSNVNNALDLYHNQITTELNSTTANLTNYVNNALAQLKIYVDSQNNYILSELRFQIELLKNSIPDLSTVYVRSPYTGRIVDIQTAINELWEYVRVNSLTAYEYDSLNLTAKAYDDLNMTAYTYDFFGRRYLYKDPKEYMYNPWTGNYELTNAVVDFMVTLIRQLDLSTVYPVLSNHAITATDYDSKKLSASVYDGKSLKSQVYDWDATAHL